MSLIGITITGADDGVDQSDLVRLAADFPFVEFGILMSQNRYGTTRYPSHGWTLELTKRATLLPRLAAHLCGKLARDVFEQFVVWTEPSDAFRRIQLNGFSCLYPSDGLRQSIQSHPSREFILQASGPVSVGYAEGFALGAGLSNVSILYDVSGGKGLPMSEAPSTWSIPMGYAGGIGPDNVVRCIERVSAANGRTPFWLDMESGVRTGDDEMDLDKVRDVLKKASPFITMIAAP